MKFETVKSFILLILVVISVSLTFGLWYYQPTYGILSNEGSMSELETDIGGEKESLADVIKPDAMVFHNNATNQHFTFKNPMEYIQLYNNMQSWSLSEFEKRPVAGLPRDDEEVEITFPTELSMELLKKMFSVNDDVVLPTWSFKQILISFDKNSSVLNVTFISSDGRNAGIAAVHNKDAYDLLWTHMSSQEKMMQLGSFEIPDSDREPIYIPSEPVSMTEYALTVDNTDPNKLVNVLFSKPSLVSTTSGESYFTDGQRGMRLLHDGKAVEFFNPYSGSYDRMNVLDLINQSIQSINDHRGWTNDYYLSDLSVATNKIKYQMHYQGYPVFSYRNLTTIGQQWRDQDLYQYNRPLFQLKNVLPREDTKELVSGDRIIEKLRDSPNYNMSKVRDLKIGYKLSYEDRATQSVTLKPTWYVNYDGNWREITFDDTDKIME